MAALPAASEPPAEPATPVPPTISTPLVPRSPGGEKRVEALKATHGRIQQALYDRIDAAAAAKVPREDLHRQILELQFGAETVIAKCAG